MKARLLAMLVPLAVSLAACAAPAEEEADSTAGASTSGSAQATMLTYLGHLPQPAAGTAKTYALEGVRPGQFAFLDVDYKDATSFAVTLAAEAKPTPSAAMPLPPSLGGGTIPDIPPLAGSQLRPGAVFVLGSEKAAPIPKAPWAEGSDVSDADFNKAIASLPARAKLVDQPRNADASFAIGAIQRTDLGIRVAFIFPSNMKPGTATIRLQAIAGR